MSDRTDLDIAHFHARLLERREELLMLLEASAPSSAPVKLDQTSVGRLSRMEAMQAQAMAQETERRRRGEIERVNAALVRIADGEYGYCVVTGEPIPIERLELDPAAPTIVKPRD